MRKTVFLFGLCALALSASAQFKVNSTGSYFITCTPSQQSNNFQNGIQLTATANGSSTIHGGYFTVSNKPTNVGFRGHAEIGNISVGVEGTSGSSTKSIGVLGSSSNTLSGAGVYGTAYGDLGSAIPSGTNYAGFFRGNVKVTGSIVGGSTIQGTFLGEAAGESGSTGGLSLRSSVANSLSGLNVTTYQKERPEILRDVVYIDDPDGLNPQDRVEPEPDIMDEQFYEKTHYALDADRLEEAFPDLVYTDKDGSKAINYVEMIPLLVQSINELSAEIETLKGQTPEGAARKARSTTDMQVSSRSQNRLYQNTPNPFKEQTVIRFSLADDVRDAAICIFDMTGKTVRKLPVSSGMESVSVGGYELGEGMFLYSLIVNGQEIDTKRMIISK